VLSDADVRRVVQRLVTPRSAPDVHQAVARVVGSTARGTPGPARTAATPPLREVARELRARFSGWRRRRLGLRGALLYLLPLPLPLAGVASLAGGDFGAAMASFGAFAALLGAAVLNRRGLREQLLAPERRYTEPPSPLHGYLAATLVATGTAIAAAGAVGHGLLVSLAFAALAGAGFHLAYPLPAPRRLLRRAERAPADERVRTALQRAEGRILAIELAADGIGNVELEARLRRVAQAGRGILALIAERPAELTRARKFLNVYLEGAERVASRYVRTHRLSRSGALESSFRNVLTQIESVFEHQRTQLLAHDVDDLDVQIAVLRKQLEHEGLS
jgi:5-bromo-4-chloroindolyl phosphate hydrolysis protein